MRKQVPILGIVMIVLGLLNPCLTGATHMDPKNAGRSLGCEIGQDRRCI